MRQREDVSIPGLDVDAIVDILSECPVKFGALYGSYARGEASSGSDLDIAVLFDDSLSSEERTRARLALIERLSTRLSMDAIDVIPLSSAPRGLRREILSDGVCLYGSANDIEQVRETGVDSSPGECRDDFDEVLAELERVV